MLFIRSASAAATVLLLVTGVTVLAGAPPALASSGHELCDEGVPIECMNAWGGGPSVRTYTPDVANDNFIVQGVNRCNNGDDTTSNCPITGNPSGLFIYQIKYSGSGTYSGDCVGDNDGLGYAELVKCNNTSYPGTGGGTATIFVQFHGDGMLLPYCESGFNWAINSHYTGLNGGWVNGMSGVEWNSQNDLLVALSGLPENCLANIPFG